MKKTFFYAICVMVLATMVAMVSCKKDEQTKPTDNPTRPAKEFTPPSVDDMNAYLGDFKSKMRNPDRDGGATMSLEEAAWHLSSVANYDFANANVEFTDIRFDTLYGHVNVTDGEVSMADLGAAYAEMSAAIDGFYHSLDLDNKHFRFIGAEISENGEVMMCMTTTYNILNHVWYFPDLDYADSICSIYFTPGVYYAANGNGLLLLKTIINSMVCTPQYPNHGRVFYTISREKGFYFLDYIDPYGSPNYANSRLYCSTSYYNTAIPANDMCYYLDSYLGLVTEHCTIDEVILFVDIFFRDAQRPQPNGPCAGNHYLEAQYGLPTINGNDINY